jgi:hypothetical protein
MMRNYHKKMRSSTQLYCFAAPPGYSTITAWHARFRAGSMIMGALGKHHLLSTTVHQDQRHFDFVASVSYSISVRAAQIRMSAARFAGIRLPPC